MKNPELLIISSNDREAKAINEVFNEYPYLPEFKTRVVKSYDSYRRRPTEDGHLPFAILGYLPEDNLDLETKIKKINPLTEVWKNIRLEPEDIKRLNTTERAYNELKEYIRGSLLTHIHKSIEDKKIVRKTNIMINGLGRYTEGLLDELKKNNAIQVHLYSRSGRRLGDDENNNEADETRLLNALELMQQDGRLEFYSEDEYDKWMNNIDYCDYLIFANGPMTNPEIFNLPEDEIRGANANKFFKDIFIDSSGLKIRDSLYQKARNYSGRTITVSNPVGALELLEKNYSGNDPKNIMGVVCEGRRFGVLIAETLNKYPRILEKRTGKSKITIEDIVYPFITGEHHDPILLMGLGNYWSVKTKEEGIYNVSELYKEMFSGGSINVFIESLENSMKLRAVKTMRWSFSKGKPYKESPMVLAEYFDSVSHFNFPPEYLSYYFWNPKEEAYLILPSKYNSKNQKPESLMTIKDMPKKIRARILKQIKIQKRLVRNFAQKPKS